MADGYFQSSHPIGQLHAGFLDLFLVTGFGTMLSSSGDSQRWVLDVLIRLYV